MPAGMRAGIGNDRTLYSCSLVLRQAKLTLEASRQAIVTVGEFEVDTAQTTGCIDHMVRNRPAHRLGI